MAHVDRAGPGGGRGQAQAVEFHLAIMAFVDMYADRRAAIAIGGQGVELAGAAIRAIAGRDLGTADHPFGKGHFCSPLRQDHPGRSNQLTWIPGPARACARKSNRMGQAAALAHKDKGNQTSKRRQDNAEPHAKDIGVLQPAKAQAGR